MIKHFLMLIKKIAEKMIDQPAAKSKPINMNHTYIKCHCFFLFLVLFFWQAGLVFSADGSLHVSASVVSTGDQPVELVTIRSMIISEEISNTERNIHISPLTSSHAGLIRAEGQPGTSVRIVYQEHEHLMDQSGQRNLHIRYELSGSKERLQESALLIDSGEHEFTLNDEGHYYLWIGCHMNIRAAAAGNYTGQFTIEIQYI